MYGWGGSIGPGYPTGIFYWTHRRALKEPLLYLVPNMELQALVAHPGAILGFDPLWYITLHCNHCIVLHYIK